MSCGQNCFHNVDFTTGIWVVGVTHKQLQPRIVYERKPSLTGEIKRANRPSITGKGDKAKQSVLQVRRLGLGTTIGTTRQKLLNNEGRSLL